MPLQGDYEPSPVDWVRRQVEQYESTGGVEGGTMKDRPVIVLTSLGAKSGRIRKTPLMRVEHDGEYAVVASMGGAPHNPTWYANLLAHPEVELQDGVERRDYSVRELTGSEKRTWWERAVETWPDYEKYQQSTDRDIPVLLLTPIS